MKAQGITDFSRSDYEQLHKSQSGLCAICREPELSTYRRGEGTRELAVDHDHATGRVRGLLCLRCNTKLDWFTTYRERIAKHLGD